MYHWKSLLVCAAFIITPSLHANPLSECYPDWQQKALTLGLSKQVVESVIPGLQLLPRVLELDRRQPEFSVSFSSYFNTRVSEQRIDRGRILIEEHRSLLNRLTQEYGVPAQYLIAFWGLETNYGSFKGNMSTLNI